jgi:hypothetical protein
LNLAQGWSHNITGSWNIAQGRDNYIYGDNNFLQGYDNNVRGSYSFAQGKYCRPNGAPGNYSNHNLVQGEQIIGSHGIQRCFAQGRNISIPRDDQKIWGSNRDTAVGDAQKSRMVKHEFTLDDTPTALVTLDLEADKIYAIRILASAINADTADEVATFSLDRASAYINSGGDAVLIEGDTLLDSSDSGTLGWTMELRTRTTSPEVILEVTGDPGDRIEWCADFEFVEVKN